MLKKIIHIGTFLSRSKGFASLAVVVLDLAAVLLVIIGILKICFIANELYSEIFITHDIDTLKISAKFLLIIEIYLQAIIFYMFSVGIYKLFVGPLQVLWWFHIDSLDEMKSELAKAVIVFLAVFMVQKIVEWKNPLEVLYFGIVIAITSANLIWYMNSLKGGMNNHNHKLKINPDQHPTDVNHSTEDFESTSAEHMA